MRQYVRVIEKLLLILENWVESIYMDACLRNPNFSIYVYEYSRSTCFPWKIKNSNFSIVINAVICKAMKSNM